jgi:hypothetical protein
MGIAQLDTLNLNVPTILCDAYQTLVSVTPYALSGDEQQAAAALTWAFNKLDAVSLGPTTLGCPMDTLSSNSVPATVNVTGGPINPPPASIANNGNNIYGEVYFPQAPTSPHC